MDVPSARTCSTRDMAWRNWSIHSPWCRPTRRRGRTAGLLAAGQQNDQAKEQGAAHLGRELNYQAQLAQGLDPCARKADLGAMAVVIDTLSQRAERHPEKRNRPDTPLLRKPDWATFSGGKNDFVLRPVTAGDLVNAAGQCAGEQEVNAGVGRTWIRRGRAEARG